MKLEQFIRKPESGDTYHRTYFRYDKQGRAWLTLQDTYELDGYGNPTTVTRLAAREFRYDGSGRQRYLGRDRDPANLALLGDASTHSLWTDYDGDTVYDDLTIDVPAGTATPYPANGVNVTEQTAYEPGDWLYDGSTYKPGVPLTDHLGTTRVMTDDTGAVTATALFTAFGEPVDSEGNIGGVSQLASRYGYVGAAGYEGGNVWGDASTNQLPYLHLGERLYDPAIGRFLQRDPIGIGGGLNVYSYVKDLPTCYTDASGTDRTWVCEWGHTYLVVDNPCGTGYYKLSFSGYPHSYWKIPFWIIMTPTIGYPGTVDVEYLPTSPLIMDYETTREEDKALLAWAFEDDFWYHPAFNQCWAWTAKGLVKGTEPPAPPYVPRYYPGCTGCFVAGTPVLTVDGLIPIDELQTGMIVFSMEPEQGVVELSRISRIVRYTVTQLVYVHLNEQVIVCSPDHPFFVAPSKWVKAYALTKGDYLQDNMSVLHVVQKVSRIPLPSPVTVYNITVDGPHTFFVGVPHILVHNKQ